jgi:hypothetical protein
MVRIPKCLFEKYGIDKISSIHMKNGTKEVIVYDDSNNEEVVKLSMPNKVK